MESMWVNLDKIKCIKSDFSDWCRITYSLPAERKGGVFALGE